MKSPALVLPAALQSLLAVNKVTEEASDAVPYVTHKLVQLRASQINGCSVCVEMHANELKKAGESDARIIAVAAWRETPYFNDAERAALALTQAETRIADRPDSVSDEIWADVEQHYDEKARAALTLSIAQINLWNRLNVTVRQMAGQKW
jgi:AhpD family alkylhydroperoxidase